MATIRKRSLSIAVLITVLAGAIALPFTLIHPVLPFALILIGCGLIGLMQHWRWLPQGRHGYLAAGLATLIILLPATSFINFVEQGFDDGPFYGAAYQGTIAEADISDRLDYRQGELLIVNQPDEQSPLLAYRVAGSTRWAQVLDVSQNPRYQDYHLVAVSDPTLALGIVRDRLDFSAEWSFGTEPGRAYVWKWGGFHRFFLSW